MYELIKLCLNNNDEWIRNSAFIALYHLNFRYREKIDSATLIELLAKGVEDNSDVVLATVNEVIDDLEIFNFEIWKKIKQ